MRWLRDMRQRTLLAKATRGDAAAFRALYGELYPLVFPFFSRRVRRVEDAEDLAARVFERLLARLDDFDPARGPVATWVLSIARNALIDFLRTSHEAVDVASLAEVLPDPGPGAHEALERGEEMAVLARLVAALDAAERELLVFRFGDGLAHAEIARLVGATPAAVRKRISRTLRELKNERRRISATQRHEEARNDRGNAAGSPAPGHEPGSAKRSSHEGAHHVRI
ncbi:MAG TPA: sigma-70 family RNA polymerase sigma factor [bacterium]|nr:sigma-70 family RNA polymerase sigma factor [bacterium]